MLNLFWKTLSDLKEPAILWRLFVPFLASIILVSILGYVLFGVFMFSDFVTQNPLITQMTDLKLEVEQTVGAVPFVGAAILWILGVVFTVIAGILGLLLGSYLTLLFAMIITGFMTDSLVKVVHDKHYQHTDYQGHGSMTGLLWKMFKFGMLLLLLFLVTLPMLFIPLINIIWFWMLGFLFFRFAVVQDVGQVILPEAVFKEVRGLNNWTPTLTVGGIFMLSLLPFLSLFVPVFAVIALSHHYFDLLSSLPKEVESNRSD